MRPLGKKEYSEMKEGEFDPINPPYYIGLNGLEAMSVIRAYGLTFNLGNSFKYLLRAGKKPGEPRVKAYCKARKNLEMALCAPRLPRTTNTQTVWSNGTGISHIALNAPSSARIAKEFELNDHLRDGVDMIVEGIEFYGLISDDALLEFILIFNHEIDHIKDTE